MKGWLAISLIISLIVGVVAAFLSGLVYINIEADEFFPVDVLFLSVFVSGACHFAVVFVSLAIFLSSPQDVRQRSWNLGRWATFGIGGLTICASIYNGLALFPAAIGGFYWAFFGGLMIIALLALAFRFVFRTKASSPPPDLASVTLKVFGDPTAHEGGCTLEARGLPDLPASRALTYIIPLLFEHQIGVHITFRPHIMAAIEDNVMTYFEGGSIKPENLQSSWPELGQILVLLHLKASGRYAVTVHVMRRQTSDELISALALNQVLPLCETQMEPADLHEMMFYMLYGWILWSVGNIQYPTTQSIWYFGPNGLTTREEMVRQIASSSILPEPIKQAALKVGWQLGGEEL